MPEQVHHHYAYDAGKLVTTCLLHLQETMHLDIKRRHKPLDGLLDTLRSTEQLLLDYFLDLIETQHRIKPTISENGLIQAMETLKTLEKQNASLKIRRNRPKPASSYQTVYSDFDSTTNTRDATDTLLFRLIVELQLCLVRIDDARFVIGGQRRQDGAVTSSVMTRCSGLLVFVGCAGAASVFLCRQARREERDSTAILVVCATKASAATLAAAFVRRQWNNLWMKDKLDKTTRSLNEWQQQWRLVETSRQQPQLRDVYAQEEEKQSFLNRMNDISRSRQLVEYAIREDPKSSLWYSKGDLRFFMLKRTMDILYASVGTAMDITKNPKKDDQHSPSQVSSTWQIPLATMAAASFYSITGASKKASETVNSSSRSLLENAWGMVSLPAIKSLALQASRFIKGAALADRIEIAGVSCFILSRDPVPELAAALETSRKKDGRKNSVSILSTIDEQAEVDPHEVTPNCPPQSFAGTCGSHRQRDVIFHLTGGGFFAHILASDVPYLLDWSFHTGAIVICPEYALLPEHCFPVALNQVTDVYCALRRGEATDVLGFEVNRIVVTGESAGGNLATALCVKLCLDRGQDPEDVTFSAGDDNVLGDGAASPPSAVERVPDAIMLCCAALNLSMELSYSKVVGTDDPVLPSGLISAISHAYLPPSLGVRKDDPLASPIYADDDILAMFPPTLIFASSTDPLLDESVFFNQRLRCLGVESELRAANNMPHAYWGLGTAGFPEARQVQKECQEWLALQLARGHYDDGCNKEEYV